MQTTNFPLIGRESTRRRNADIIRRFAMARAAAAPGGVPGRREMLRRVRRLAPAAYFVSFRSALDRLTELRTNPELAARRGKVAYWQELADKVEAERASGRSQLTMEQALLRVLAAGRPSSDCLSDSYLWRIYSDHISHSFTQSNSHTRTNTRRHNADNY